jgi:hypothetical protein
MVIIIFPVQAQQPLPDARLPITNYPLPITHYPSKANFRLKHKVPKNKEFDI